MTDQAEVTLAEVVRRLDELRDEVVALRREGRPRRVGQPLLSLREAARRLGVSRNSTLVDLIRDRRIRTTKVNGRVRVPAAEVERLIREATR